MGQADTSPNAKTLFIFMAVVVALYAALSLLQGGLYVANYEGDTAHLLDLSMRLAEGQAPHTDFMTPLGVLSFAPISLFLSFGHGAGHAVLCAQILAAVLLFPAAYWAAQSRLKGPLAYAFGFYVLVLVMALAQGQSATHTTLAMHYNRWAWAVSYVVILVAVLPSLKQPNARLDGIVIGAGMAFLALSKLTYFVAFAPPVLLALLMRKEYRAIVWAASTGVVAMAAMTLWLGVGFWTAYAFDVISVAQSDVRPYPNKPLLDMLRQPGYIGATLLVFAAVIFLRQAKQEFGGLILLILAPAFFYVTFQNFGNDPQWLVLLVLLVLALLPEGGVVNKFGWDLRQSLALTAAGLAAFASPAAVNMVFSPKIHLGYPAEDFTAFLPTRAQHSDLRGKISHAFEIKANTRLQVPEAAPVVLANIEEQEATILNGEALPACEIFEGAVGFFSSIAEELTNAGYGPQDHFLVTDIINVIWLFGDFEPLPGGAPWYYGGTPGLEHAEYVLVPMCPYRMSERHRILGLIEEQGYALREAYRSPAFLLLKPEKNQLQAAIAK